MKTVNIELKLYSLNELSDKAKQAAIEEHRNFLLSVMTIEDFISGDPEYDTEEELEKTFEAEYDYILYNDDSVIESLEMNDYLFFESGKLANTSTYVGKHPKAGTTEFFYNGNIYLLK